ncbi:MAG: nucleoside hydrolase, partial [Chloroflexi bacterium]|nr:nucleoside hydrolase [Chloroflexota bacterium]
MGPGRGRRARSREGGHAGPPLRVLCHGTQGGGWYSQPGAAVSKKVIIDTDPGTDDAIALMMALQSPDLDVLALTTVGGNAALRHTTRNALRVLEYMGREDIPVLRGAARPLKGKFAYGYYYHGPAGLTVRLPLPAGQPE